MPQEVVLSYPLLITGSGDHFFVINLAVSEFVCKFAIVKQYSWKIYGQTDTEEKRNRYLPCNAQRHQPPGHL